MLKQQFELGQVVATPAALATLDAIGHNLMHYLIRHGSGDWGDMSDSDKAENEYSVNRHLRLMSAYNLPDDSKIWLITEADRSATTLLLPSDY